MLISRPFVKPQNAEIQVNRLNIVVRRILWTLVTMDNNILGTTLIFISVYQCSNYKCFVHFSAVMITYNLTCANVQNAGEISPAMLDCMDICNIRKPYLIRLRSRKILIYKIVKLYILLFLPVIIKFLNSICVILTHPYLHLLLWYIVNISLWCLDKLLMISMRSFIPLWR